MRALFYDTETSGLPDFRAPSESPHQPHIVQVAASLVDCDTRAVLASIDLVVAPTDWDIPAEVSAVHGITVERARDIGVSEHLAVEALLALWQRADYRVAHNEQFDARILRIGLMRFGTGALVDAWRDGRAECTANMATPLCKMPPTQRMRSAGLNSFKTPKLTEAHAILLGLEFENAHSALADVDACRRIYWHMKDAERVS